MKYIVYAIYVLSLIMLANGAVAFYFRYNFITQTQYDVSIRPIEIIVIGIVLGVVGLLLNNFLRKGNQRG